MAIMDIKIYINNDILYINFNNNKIKVINTNYLNLIFIDNNNNYNILLDSDIENNIEKYIKGNKYLLIIGYELEGSNNIIKYLKGLFKLKFIEFSKVNLYYICGIYLEDNIIDREDIYTKFDKIELKIDINILYKDIEYNDKNIENVKKDIGIIDKTLEKFITTIKDVTINEIDIRRNNIYLKFNILEELIDNITLKYDKIEEVIDKRNSIIRDIKLNNINDNISDNVQFENKTKYTKELLKTIEDIENIKKNKLKYLENVEKEIKSREDNINKLTNDINIETNKLNLIRKKNINIPNKNKNNNIIINKDIIGVFVHLFKIEVWEDIYRYLKNLYDYNYKYDLYINIATNTIEELQQEKYINLRKELEMLNIYNKLFITYSDNRGMDIGGFMKSYIKMIDLKMDYKYIIKIHSKTNDNWRFALLYSLFGNKKITDNNFYLLKNDNIGMIGNQIIPLNGSINKNSYRYIDVYMKTFKIPISVEGHFIPGTIFIIKNDILKKYFNKTILEKCYKEFSQDYCGSKKNIMEGLPHAFERFFGVLVENYGKKTVKFDTNL